jgi:hypothetical protein
MEKKKEGNKSCKDCGCFNCATAKDSGGTCINCDECIRREKKIPLLLEDPITYGCADRVELEQ